jgi:hypothetical protein
MKNTLIWVFLSLCLLIPTVVVYGISDGAVLQLEDSQYLSVKKNANLTIDESAVINKTGKLPFTFAVVRSPSHGNVHTNGSILTYIPFSNYTGSDSSTFKAIAIDTTPNENLSSNIERVSIRVDPKPLLSGPTEVRVALGFGLSLVIVFLIFILAYFLVRKRRREEKIDLKFWDIIRDDNWYPSLAIFQFLLWTGIVLFAYFGIALTRFFSGVGVFIEFPSSLILVMGISAGVPITGTVISHFKYGGTTPPNVESTKEAPSDRIRKILPGFKTSLMENGKLTLPRFQMFAWTWIGIIAYLGLLYLEIVTNLDHIESLFLPGIPILFVSLMGLSQATYLTAKSVRPSYFAINEVRPRKIRIKQKDNFITVLGSNFGSNGTVWIEYYPTLTDEEKAKYYKPPTDEEKARMDKRDSDAQEREWDDKFRYDRTRLEEQFNVTPDKLEARKDNRITVSLDRIIYELEIQRYVVSVERDGLVTYANSDATFDIIYCPPKADSQSVSTEENQPLEINLKAKAKDPIVGGHLTYSKVLDPLHGRLNNLEPSTGKVTYIPNPSYVGDDIFTFKANDGKMDGNESKVTISVIRAATPPQ